MALIQNKRILYPLIVVASIAMILLVLITWIIKGGSGKRTVLSAIPEDAVFLVESSNLGKAVEEIKQNKIWPYLKEHGNYASIDNYTRLVDSVIEEYPSLVKLLKNKDVGLSSHIVKGNKYDFLYVLNLGNISKIAGMDDIIGKMVESESVHMKSDSIAGIKLWKIKSKMDKRVAHIAILDNLGLFSFSEEIIVRAIKERDSANWEHKLDKSEAVGDELISFYFNYNELKAFSRCFFHSIPGFIEPFANSLNLTKIDADIEDDFYSFTGVTDIKDSVANYVSALTTVDAGKFVCDRISPGSTAAYFSCSFASVDNLLEKLFHYYHNNDSIAAVRLEKNISRIEKFLELDIQEDILDWIGEEIAMVKLQPQNNIKENDVLLIVHSDDIDKARKGIEKIERNAIKGIAKIENIEYHGFNIKYLNIKGFFKLFFGKWFKNIDRPYYTIIDDYVLFSNSHYCLSRAIDDYLKEQSLSDDNEFKAFKDNFSKKANFSLFIRTPRLYSHLDYFSKGKTRMALRKNKESIMSFSELGMQLVSDNNSFKTYIAGKHDPDAAFNAEIELLDLAADDIDNLYYEQIDFKVVPQVDTLGDRDKYEIMNRGTGTKAIGNVRAGKPEGIWRTYYINGKVESVVHYKAGKITGEALFYYNSHRNHLKAEVEYEDDEIIGKYREYYRNATRKAVLEYRNGKAHGDAEFYYSNGNLKIKGEYRKGKRCGRWKYYTVKGELFDKMRVKK